MMALIQRYSAAERLTAFTALGIGIVLRASSVILWRISAITSLARGMAYEFLTAGVLRAATSLGYTAVVAPFLNPPAP